MRHLGWAVRTALVATALNRLTILSWAALFMAASAADLARTPLNTPGFVVGVELGEVGWTSLHSAVVLFGPAFGELCRGELAGAKRGPGVLYSIHCSSAARWQVGELLHIRAPWGSSRWLDRRLCSSGMA